MAAGRGRVFIAELAPRERALAKRVDSARGGELPASLDNRSAAALTGH